jgi:enoyl-CoA hydratase/carnithine racemase
MRRQSIGEARERLGNAQAVTRAIVNGPKPVLAAVEGHAIGAGLGIAASCDRLVVASDAQLATSFTSIGLFGDLGITWSLPRRVGPSKARQMLLMPTRLSGVEAFQIGLADRVTAPGEAFVDAMQDAQVLAEGPPLALAAVKSILNHGPQELSALLDRELEHQAELFTTADFAEGLTALKERRPPRFTGS